MFSILMYEPDPQKAEWLRTAVTDLFISKHLELQLSTYSNPLPVFKKIRSGQQQNDVWMLNSQDPIMACRMAGMVRKLNVQSSIIILAPDYKKVLAFIPYRISAFFTWPIAPGRLQQTLCRVLEEQTDPGRCFSISNKSRMVRFPLHSIEYFQSDLKYTTIHLNSMKEEYQFMTKLDDIEKKLPPEMFLRCHQSYIVNMRQISRIDKHNKTITLFGGAEIPISKSRYTEILGQCEAELSR